MEVRKWERIFFICTSNVRTVCFNLWFCHVEFSTQHAIEHRHFTVCDGHPFPERLTEGLCVHHRKHILMQIGQRLIEEWVKYKSNESTNSGLFVALWIERLDEVLGDVVPDFRLSQRVTQQFGQSGKFHQLAPGPENSLATWLLFTLRDTGSSWAVLVFQREYGAEHGFEKG